MAGILDSLFGDLQGTSAGGLLGMLGGGNIGTATRRLRTPEEEQQAALKGDYLGVTPQVPQAFGGNLSLPSQVPSGFPATAPPQDYVGTPGALDPKWQALLAGNTDPYQPNAQLPPTATPTVGAQNGPGVTLPQMGDGGFGRNTGPQNPLMGLLGGIGNLFGTSSAQAAPAPGAAQQPGIPAQAAAGPASGPGLFGRLQAGATNLSSGGNPLAGLINAVGGLATGERTDRQGIALRNQELTYRAFKAALMAKGASEPQAEALAQSAAVDSEVKKTVASTLYQTPALVSGGTNPLTGEVTHQVYNPNNQTLTNLGANAQGAGGSSQILTPANAAAVGLPPMSNNQLAQIQALNQEGLPPDEYAARLKAISPAYAAKATGMSKGDLPYPSGPMMKTPYGQLLTDSISSIKPGVTAQDYGSKQKARNYITSGPGGQEIKAANTFIYHADKMMDQSELMGGFDTLPAVLNPAFQGLKNQFPQLDPKYQTARKKWDELSEIASTEVAKALNGGTPHVADKEHWRKIFAAADGPIQRKAAISGAMEAIDGRMDAASKFYEQSMGETKDPISFIDPANKAKYAKVKGVPVSEITGGGQGAAGQQQEAAPKIQEGATATNPKTGQRIIYKGGQWQPMK